jgi:cyanophycinase
MSIHLAGGGWSEELFRSFLLEASARAAGAGRVVPRIGILLVAEDAESGLEAREKYTSMLVSIASCEPIANVLVEGDLATSLLLSDIDALLIGGGLTPAYLDAVTPLVDEIRLLVADGLPYLGFSAGAAIAAERAIIGGWLIGDVPVCAEDTSENLDEVTVAAGLGLVDLSIDVHAAQWGTLARLIAATEAELVDGGLAIDENTVLIVGDGMLRVQGLGSVWQVAAGDEGVVVVTLGP